MKSSHRGYEFSIEDQKAFSMQEKWVGQNDMPWLMWRSALYKLSAVLMWSACGDEGERLACGPNHSCEECFDLGFIRELGDYV